LLAGGLVLDDGAHGDSGEQPSHSAEAFPFDEKGRQDDDSSESRHVGGFDDCPG